MPAEYYDFVVAVYQKKIAENNISRHLINPSPEKMRRACVARHQEPYPKKYDKVLVDFFGDGGGKEGYLNRIKKWDLDKFRPLINFLRQTSGNTSLINIELLAWLIEAPHTPYQSSNNYIQLKEELDMGLAPFHAEEVVGQETGKVVGSHTEANEAGTQTSQQYNRDESEKAAPVKTLLAGFKEENDRHEIIGAVKKFSRGKKIVVGAALAGVLIWLGVATYHMVGKPVTSQSCMYWADDHFVQISCNQKMKGVLVIAYDSARLHDFKKVTIPDTITYRSIGHLWYSKMENEVEFYTAPGSHPVKTYHQLKPATPHMIETYGMKMR